jgi:CubicO group peptidase (beta-lactamase class C family)
VPTPALERSAAAQTAASYRAQPPTIREQELQATISALSAELKALRASAEIPTPTAHEQALAATITSLQAGLAAGPQGAPAPPAPGADPALNAALDSYINSQVAAGIFSGAVLVARDGQVVLGQGYGQADAENGVANTPQTKFRIGSLTKQFTAAAILLLEQDGRLHLDYTVCDYIPDCPPAWKPVSIRTLLTHTSGIPNYTDFADFGLSEPNATTPEELIGRFRDLPLLFAPGEIYSYGNSNYVVLGYVIERITGQPYAQFLQQRIFGPLGMTNTGYDRATDVLQNRAAGYLSPTIQAPFHDMSTLYAAGGLYSTVEDLLRWDQTLYTDRPISAAMRNQMFTPFKGQYGLGWKILNMYNRRVISHPGLVTGFSAYIARYPDDRVTIIVLSNLQSAPSEQIGIGLAGIVFGGR